MASATHKYWSMTEGVFDCLIDIDRTVAFKSAIENTVRPGDVVVDMGAGSGVLSMFAAKAGARKVYAVEIDRNYIETLRHTFQANGLGDKIEVINVDVRKLVLPEKVDVIIGEMIATGLIEELQVPAMNRVLKYAQPDVRVVLSRYKALVDLVHSNDQYYDCQFKVVRYEYPDMKRLRSTSYSKAHTVFDLDFTRRVSRRQVEGDFQISIEKAGVVNAIRLRGQTTFFDGSVLGATYAYDYPIILPVDELHVAKGDVISLRLAYRLCGGMQTLSYSAEKAG